MKVVRMKDDARPIQPLTIAGEGGAWWAVGRDGITKIEVYLENGQMAQVPWLAVYRGDSIATRVNCAAVEWIDYK